MKYTRDNIDNATLLTLLEKAVVETLALSQLKRDIEDWMQYRDEQALDRVLLKLNEGEHG